MISLVSSISSTLRLVIFGTLASSTLIMDGTIYDAATLFGTEYQSFDGYSVIGSEISADECPLKPQ